MAVPSSTKRDRRYVWVEGRGKRLELTVPKSWDDGTATQTAQAKFIEKFPSVPLADITVQFNPAFVEG